MKKFFLMTLFAAAMPFYPLYAAEQSEVADTLLKLNEVKAEPVDTVFNQWYSLFFENWEGKPATRENVESLISNLLHHYSQNGFPFAEISPSVEKTDDRHAALKLFVIEGPMVYVSQVSFAPFSSGEQKQLARILGFYPGVFDEREVEEMKKRSARFPELVWEGESKLTPAPEFSSARLELPLARRSKNRVEGGLGYLPSASDNGAFGELAVQLVTLGKIGREVHFNWRRPSSKTQILSLGYQDFFLTSAPLYFSAQVSQEEKEEQYFQFSARTEVAALVFGPWRVAVQLGYDRITPSEGAVFAGTNNVPARRYEAGASLQWGERTSDFLALQGRFAYKKTYFIGGVQTGNPSVLGLEAAKIISVVSSWKLFVSARGEARFVPPFLFTRSDLFYLGGYSTLRGYVDESLLATKYVLGRAEPRYHFGNKNYLFGFFDFGYLSADKKLSGISVADHFKPAAGLGLSASSDRLVLAFAWAEKAKIKDGIVYLRLTGEL